MTKPILCVGHLCKRCMPKPAGVTIQVDSVRLKP